MSDSNEQLCEKILAHLPGLSDEQARRLAAIAHERFFKPGEVVFNEGDIAEDLFLLLEGCVFLGAKFSKRTGTVTFASLGPSEFFGWSAMVAPYQKTAHAEVIKPSKVLVFNGRELLSLCDQDRMLGYIVMRNLLATVGKRLVATRQRILDMLN